LAIWIAAGFCLLFFGSNIFQWIRGFSIKKVRDAAQSELLKRNQLIKKFKKYNEDGNETMNHLLDIEEIDLEADGNGRVDKIKKMAKLEQQLASLKDST